MALGSKKFWQGIILKVLGSAETPTAIEGAVYTKNDGTKNRLWAYIQGAVREILTNNEVQTLTNKTIDVDNNTVSNIEVDNLKSTAKTGADAKVVTGTAGTASNFAMWNADGDAVDSTKAVPSGTVVGTTDTQTLTGKTIDGDNNTVQNLALSTLKTVVGDANKFLQRDGSGVVTSGKSVPTGDVIGTTDTQTLTNKTIDVDNNSVSNLETDNFKTSAKTGNDAKLVTGTAGTADNFPKWNSDGDIVDSTKAVPTGAVVGTTDTQTITNKTFDDELRVKELTSTTSPSAGYQKIYPKDDGKWYTKNSSGIESEIGAGNGGFDYIDNGGAEQPLSGWVFKDASNANQTRFTITRNTTSPLRGVGDFKLESFSGALAGDYVAYAFTADEATMITKMLTVGIDVIKYSSLYQNEDIQVTLRDTTANVDLRTDFFLDTNPKFSADYQVGVNNTLELRFVLKTPFATRKMEEYLDGISVKPQAPSVNGSYSFGEVYYAPLLTSTGGGAVTLNTGSTNAPSGYYTVRDGRMILDLSFRNGFDGSASGSAGTLEISIPSGFTIDVDNLPPRAGGLSAIGYLMDSTGKVGNVYIGTDNNKLRIYMHTAVNPFAISDIVAGYGVNIKAEFPILGWSSNMALSSSTQNREYYFSATGLASGTVTVGTPFIFNTVTNNTLNMTYSSGVWTALEDGTFLVNAGIESAGTTSFVAAIYINGTQLPPARLMQKPNTSPAQFSSGVRTITLKKGDTFEIRNIDALQTFGTTNNFVNIYKLNTGSQTFAKDAIQRLKVRHSGAFDIPNSLTTLTGWLTPEVDSHGNFNVTTGELIVARDGYLSVSAGVECSVSGGFSPDGILVIALYKGNTSTGVWARSFNPVSGNLEKKPRASLSDNSIRVSKGDIITLRVNQSQTTTVPKSLSAPYNYLSIEIRD